MATEGEIQMHVESEKAAVIGYNISCGLHPAGSSGSGEVSKHWREEAARPQHPHHC